MKETFSDLYINKYFRLYANSVYEVDTSLMI